MSAARLNTIRKFVAACVGLVAEAVTLGLVHGTALQVAVGVIAAATAVGVYAVPNELPPAAH